MAAPAPRELSNQRPDAVPVVGLLIHLSYSVQRTTETDGGQLGIVRGVVNIQYAALDHIHHVAIGNR